MNKLSAITLVLTFLLSTFIFGQTPDRIGPIETGTSQEMYEVPSLASKWNELIPYVDVEKEMQDGKATPYDIVAGKGSSGEDLLAENQGELYQKIQAKTPSIVFTSAFSSSSPTDPAGAVGPNLLCSCF